MFLFFFEIIEVNLHDFVNLKGGAAYFIIDH